MPDATPLRAPELRCAARNDQPVREDGDYVLYWMIAQRRCTANFALQHALWYGQQLGKPVFVLEPLRIGYRWASDRHHAFAIGGMADNKAWCDARGITYRAYLEPEDGAGRGLLAALAERACLVVTDDYPCFFLPRMVTAAAGELSIRLGTVDSNGLLPLRAADRDFTTAASFRRFLQKNLAEHLERQPLADPTKGLSLPDTAPVPRAVTDRWSFLTQKDLDRNPADVVAELPIDHSVPVVEDRPGGAVAGTRLLETFLAERLPQYHEARNEPEKDVASGLSPYLHYGHVGTHQVCAALWEREDWRPGDQSDQPTGSREGWWRMSEPAEAFLDELITWREIGYVFTHRHPDNYHRLDSLPNWARTTMREHADDEREPTYSLEEFDRAETHDPLWNAAQNQLRQDGRIHNYLRMLWGKKIYEWTEDPESALEIMIELNNRYALDGRDPNSYSGIFWVMGRFDRAWGPERKVFGKLRYMTSENTARKVRVRDYIARWNGEQLPGLTG